MKLSFKSKLILGATFLAFTIGTVSVFADRNKNDKEIVEVSEVKDKDYNDIDESQLIKDKKEEETVYRPPVDINLEKNASYVDGLKVKFTEKNKENDLNNENLKAKKEEDALAAQKLKEEEAKKAEEEKKKEEEELVKKRKEEEDRIKKELASVESNDDKDKEKELALLSFDKLEEKIEKMDDEDFKLLDVDEVKSRSRDYDFGVIDPSKSDDKYKIDDLEKEEFILWNGYKITSYPEHVFAGDDLDIPGRSLKDGFVIDKYGFICVASDYYEKGTIIMSPFGRAMRVYDTFGGDEPENRIDVYVR